MIDVDDTPSSTLVFCWPLFRLVHILRRSHDMLSHDGNTNRPVVALMRFSFTVHPVQFYTKSNLESSLLQGSVHKLTARLQAVYVTLRYIYLDFK